MLVAEAKEKSEEEFLILFFPASHSYYNKFDSNISILCTLE